MPETLVSRARETDSNGVDFARKITEGFEPPRQPGPRSGTYTRYCPRCNGSGLVLRFCEICLTCDGSGVITMSGQRASDLRERQRPIGQPTWGDIAYWMICSAGVTAGLLYLLCWRYGLL